MYKKLHQILPNKLIIDARSEIEKSSILLKSEMSEILDPESPNGVRNVKVYRVTHDDIISLPKFLDIMFYPSILDQIKNLFNQVYLINHFYCTVNGYSNKIHRDGQSMGFNKKALLASKKIFKVIIYLNDNHKLEAGGIDICPINSDPIEVFENERLFTKVNYYVENYIKKKILLRINSKIGDALIMDSNVWHRASIRNSAYSENEVNKIYIAYEFVTDKEIAIFYSRHMSEKYKIKTSNTNIPKELLHIFRSKGIKLLCL
jgi:thiamine kinase-like enzyme